MTIKLKWYWILLIGVALGIILSIVTYKIFEDNTVEEPKIVYVPQPTLQGTLKNFKLAKIEFPSYNFLHYYRDTVYIDSTVFITQPVDSLEILRDWLSKRHYSEVLFDNDTLGKFELDLLVHKNQLQQLDYRYNPVKRVEYNTTQVRPKFELLAGVGLTTNNYANVHLGGFRNNFGLTLDYYRSFHTNDYGIGLTAYYKLNFY